MTVTVERWAPGIELRDKPQSLGATGGWFVAGLRWPDYVAHMQAIHTGTFSRGHLEALRADIVARNMRVCGDDLQGELVPLPLFSDDTTADYSTRGWSDLLAAIWSTADGADYAYTDWMRNPVPGVERKPIDMEAFRRMLRTWSGKYSKVLRSYR